MKARILAGEGQEGLWLRAEKQNAGIGRLGRKWESPSGNLYCSTIIDRRTGDPSSSTLSFVTALALYDLLAANLTDRQSVMLKWPNDVLVNNAKVSGILLEVVSDKIIVGVGLNIAFYPELSDRKATSIRHANPDNDKTVQEIFESFASLFETRVNQWRGQGAVVILSDWQKYAHNIGDSLQVSVNRDEKISGQFAGLNEEGVLRLRKADGTLIDVHAGDIELG